MSLLRFFHRDSDIPRGCGDLAFAAAYGVGIVFAAGGCVDDKDLFGQKTALDIARGAFEHKLASVDGIKEDIPRASFHGELFRGDDVIQRDRARCSLRGEIFARDV